jgi:hypothetical protein
MTNLVLLAVAISILSAIWSGLWAQRLGRPVISWMIAGALLNILALAALAYKSMQKPKLT